MFFELDYQFALSDCPQGSHILRPEQLQSLDTSIKEGWASFFERTRNEEIGFWNLIDDNTQVTQIHEFTDHLPSHIRHVIVLGIGGSSLGGQSMVHALTPACSFANQQRHVAFADNVDPWKLACFIKHLNPEQTLAIVISKSGGTIETISQLAVVEDWLKKSISQEKLKEHLVFITDPQKGYLRTHGETHHIPLFDIPSNVGGRFSVLTPVGLLPAHLAGIDIQKVLSGAKQMKKICEVSSFEKNPASIFAALLFQHHTQLHHPTQILMPYCEALKPFSSWWVQLWAESLGKRFDRDGNRVEVGPTPICAIGSTDQHAQLQLFIEGPRDKLLIFLTTEETESDLQLTSPNAPFDFLANKSLFQVLKAEQRATALALAQDNRPSLTIRIPRIDEESLGALFFFFEAATAISGELYNINAFDQPGVELGKQLTYSLLGKPIENELVSNIVATEENSKQASSENAYKLTIRT